MTTNLLLTDDTTLEAVQARVNKWSGANTAFSSCKSTARAAALEFTLNEMGLTAYEYRHDETLLTRMDEWLWGMGKESRERWCEADVCGCMGCVNHAAYQHGITKRQWKIWILSRTPGLAEEWAKENAYWAALRAEREAKK